MNGVSIGATLDRFAQILCEKNFGDWNLYGLADRLINASQNPYPPAPTVTIPPLTYTLTPEQLEQLNDAQLVHEAMKRGYAIMKIKAPK